MPRSLSLLAAVAILAPLPGGPLWIGALAVERPGEQVPRGADSELPRGGGATDSAPSDSGSAGAPRGELRGTPSWAGKYQAEAYPATMHAGDAAAVSLTMKNVGTATWGTKTHLGTSNPRDRISVFAGPGWLQLNRPAGVSGSVPPGGTFTFSFTLYAPVQPGTYTEHWNMLQENVHWFSDAGQGGPSDTAIWFKITVLPAVVGTTASTTAATTAGVGGAGGAGGGAGGAGAGGAGGVSGAGGAAGAATPTSAGGAGGSFVVGAGGSGGGPGGGGGAAGLGGQPGVGGSRALGSSSAGGPSRGAGGAPPPGDSNSLLHGTCGCQAPGSDVAGAARGTVAAFSLALALGRRRRLGLRQSGGGMQPV